MVLECRHGPTGHQQHAVTNQTRGHEQYWRGKTRGFQRKPKNDRGKHETSVAGKTVKLVGESIRQQQNRNKSTCLQAVCRMKSCNINGLQMGIWLAMNRKSVVANWQSILCQNRGFVFGRSYKDSIH